MTGQPLSTTSWRDNKRAEEAAVAREVILESARVSQRREELMKRKAGLVRAQHEAGETRNPYTVTINPIAMRTAPKYAESSGYTWLQWFSEMLSAWKNSSALAPLLEKAVCAKELQLEWAANI